MSAGRLENGKEIFLQLQQELAQLNWRRDVSVIICVAQFAQQQKALPQAFGVLQRGLHTGTELLGGLIADQRELQRTLQCGKRLAQFVEDVRDKAALVGGFLRREFGESHSHCRLGVATQFVSHSTNGMNQVW